MSQSLVILKVVSSKGRATLHFVLAQPVLIIWSFLTGYLSPQSRKETLVSALQKSGQVQTKEKKDPTTLGDSEECQVAKQEEGSPVTQRPCDRGKDSDGGVSAPSAFRPLIVNGVLSSFIPKPGPLGRDDCSKNSAKSRIKESHIAFRSSCKRNAIASSYSSSLAQWPPERIRVRVTQSAAAGAATGATGHAATRGVAAGAATDAATCPTQGASKDVVSRATRGFVKGVASRANQGVAKRTAACETQGAAPGAAPGDASGGATGDAPGTAAGAGGARATTGVAPRLAFGDDAHTTQGAVAGVASDPAAGVAPGAAAGATQGATKGAAAYVTGGASKGTTAHDTQVAASGDDTSGPATGGDALATMGAASGIAAGAAPSALSLPSQASCQLQVSAKKVSEKGWPPGSSGSLKKRGKKPRKSKHETVTDAPQVQQKDPKNGLPTSDIPRPVRRKIPLLLPRGRDAPLILPPALELSFCITVEDFDLEKKAAIQWINKALKDSGAKARCH